MTFRFLFGLLCFFLSIPVLATDRFTSATGGSNSGACTSSASPCDTITYATGQMAAGDTLYFCAADPCATGAGTGTFVEELYEIWATDGSAGSRYTFTTYSNNVITIRPTSGNGYVLETDQDMSYLTFRGTNTACASAHTCTLILDDGGYSSTCDDGNGCQVAKFYSDNITMENVEIKGGSTDGACVSMTNSLGQGRNGTFTRMWVHDCGASEFDNGFYLQNTGNIVQDSDIGPNVAGACIQLYSGDTSGGRVSGNYCHDGGLGGSNRGQGIVVFNVGSAGTIVYNNIVDTISGNGSGSGGILIGGDSTNVRIYNNTIYNLSSGVYGVENGLDAGTGNIIQNNIAYMTNGIACSVACATNDHNLTTDPAVVNAAGGDFHLTAGSSGARDQAVNESAYFTVDKDGAVRGASWDIGAYEYNAPASGFPIKNVMRSIVIRSH